MCVRARRRRRAIGRAIGRAPRHVGQRAGWLGVGMRGGGRTDMRPSVQAAMRAGGRAGERPPGGQGERSGATIQPAAFASAFHASSARHREVRRAGGRVGSAVFGRAGERAGRGGGRGRVSGRTRVLDAVARVSNVVARASHGAAGWRRANFGRGGENEAIAPKCGMAIILHLAGNRPRAPLPPPPSFRAQVDARCAQRNVRHCGA